MPTLVLILNLFKSTVFDILPPNNKFIIGFLKLTEISYRSLEKKRKIGYTKRNSGKNQPKYLIGAADMEKEIKRDYYLEQLIRIYKSFQSGNGESFLIASVTRL